MSHFENNQKSGQFHKFPTIGHGGVGDGGGGYGSGDNRNGAHKYLIKELQSKTKRTPVLTLQSGNATVMYCFKGPLISEGNFGSSNFPKSEPNL